MSHKQIILKVLMRYQNLLHESTIQKTLVDVLKDKGLRESFAEDLCHEISINMESEQRQVVSTVNRICLN
ncbi:MAG: hypothetical protein H6585_13250 [Flavobacteriales bacterium]|nr:hypothetical protein [Flavobacteriales bacterium]MCB9449300.1 hypothetical protein [Flavobacteriales bacterium]